MLFTGLVSVHSENHTKHTRGNVNTCGTQSNHYACKGQNPNEQMSKETSVMLMYKANTLHNQQHRELLLYEQKGYKVLNNKWIALPS